MVAPGRVATVDDRRNKQRQGENDGGDRADSRDETLQEQPQQDQQQCRRDDIYGARAAGRHDDAAAAPFSRSAISATRLPSARASAFSAALSAGCAPSGW